MSDHIPDLTKMIQDTPRTDAAYFKPHANTKLTIPIKDTIILDSKKCNAELLTIHSDGRITVAEHLKPTETAANVLQIMREQWMDSIQSKKIREQEDRIKQLENSRTVAAANSLANMLSYDDAITKIKRLEEAGDALENDNYTWEHLEAWHKAKEAKP